MDKREFYTLETSAKFRLMIFEHKTEPSGTNLIPVPKVNMVLGEINLRTIFQEVNLENEKER